MLRFQLDRLKGLAVDHVVVATSTLTQDDPVAELAEDAGVKVVRGPEADVLDRFIVALDAHPADTLVRLTGDCPLTDPRLVERVVDEHHRQDADYTTNVLPRTFPKGLDVEVVRSTALRVAAAEAVDTSEREHVTPFLYRRPERFRLVNVRSGEQLGDERWTVDTSDDLSTVRYIVDAAGGDGRFPWTTALDVVGRQHRPQPGELHLRPATQRDSGDLLRWRNEADTRRFSRVPDPVDPADHERWLTDRLDDPATRLLVAEIETEPIGQIRIDVINGTGTMGITVAPERRGQRLATGMLETLQRQLRDDYQIERLVAEVRPTNTASRRAFLGASFTPTQPQDGFDRFTWENIHR